MGLPTVQTLQRLALPAGTRLVGGGSGLSRGVSWPATLRTRAPAFPSLKTGEFLLISTASLSLLDSDLSLIKLLQNVLHFGVSGAAIAGDIPADCIAWADRHDLPLFQLPPASHLGDVESAISRTIADSRQEFDRRAHELYRQLTQVAIEDRGMAAIVEELARVSGKPALFLDIRLQPRERFPADAVSIVSPDFNGVLEKVSAWARRVPVSAAEPPVQFFSLTSSSGVLLAPVMTRDGIAGYMAAASHQSALDGLDEAAVAGAAASGAIELARERAVLQAQERAQGSIVEEIAAGTAGPTELMRRKAAIVDIDLDAKHLALVIAVSGAEVTPIVLDSCVREARNVLGAVQGGIVAGRLALISAIADRRVVVLADALHELLGRRFQDADVTIGIGRFLSGLEGLRQSYREAIEALTLGRDIYGLKKTTLFSDLGLYRLLLTLRDHPELERFYQDTMGKLALVDAKGGGELVRTLDAYFASNGSPTEAASRLHVHRNTLLYRLQRIRAMAEIDLDDPEIRLSLQVALRIRRILAPTGQVKVGEAAS